MASLFTCSRCGRTYAIPDLYAGLVCLCSFQPQASQPVPSPASTAPVGASLGVSSGAKDGGRGAGDGASGSPGRGPEKGSQRPPGAQGGPIAAAAKDLPDDYKPDRGALDRAQDWFQAKFFKKGGIGENDWRPLVAACKTWGMPENAKWRDWLKEQWDTNRAVAVKVLITAKAITGPSSVPDDLKKLLAVFDGLPDKMFTLSDLVAQAGPATNEAQLDKLVDLGLVWEPVLGSWRSMKGQAAPKGG